MNLIVAVDSEWGIGCGGELLAHIPGDLKYFKETTMDKVVVMGRRTLESLPGKKGLPKRVNFVLTGNPEFEAERFMVNLDEDARFRVTWESELQNENGIEYQFVLYERS